MSNRGTQHSVSRSSLRKLIPYLALAMILILWLVANTRPARPAYAVGRAIAGRVLDRHDEPVDDVQVSLYFDAEAGPVAEAYSQDDGSFLLIWGGDLEWGRTRIVFERPHFDDYVWKPDEVDLVSLNQDNTLVLDDIVLDRQFGLSFWLTTITFIGMLALIAVEYLHKTLVALLTVVALLCISLIGGVFSNSLYIIDFEDSLQHVDFDVIFLLMGMMIIIGIIEETGIFQWLAYQAYRMSRGKVWLLSLILLGITAFMSALLDNVTTMLLMTPITLQIALAMDIDPLSLLVPEVLASNVGGLATLVGTPANILVGSYAGLSFSDFLINQAPGALLALLGLTGFMLLWYRKEYRKGSRGISPKLLKRLEENARIDEPRKLLKTGIVFVAVLILFFVGEPLHLPPSVAALIGAVVMLLWIHPHVEEMMTVVDWTTLIFFIGLFMVIGAVEEVGLIFLIADQIGAWVSGNLGIALLVFVWVAAIISGVVDNIPFAAAMLPVARFLSLTIPGAESHVLYYGLAFGANLGGNTTLIGSSSNLVTAGISARAGFPITFKRFLIVGLPATVVTTTLGCVWLFIRFF